MSKSVWDQQTNRGICCRPDCNASVTSVCREGTCCPLITLKLTSVTLYYPTPLWMKDTTCGLSLVLYINTELFDWFSMRWNWSNWQSWGLSFWKPDWEFPLVRPRSWWCLELCRKFSSSWPDRSEMWSNNTIFNINRNHETITRIQMMEIGKVSFQKLYWIGTRNFGEKKLIL